MIIKYKSISTIQKKDVTGSQPTHYLKAQKDKDDKEGVFVASLWSKAYEKEGVTKKFLAGNMNDEYNGKTGYVIVSETDLDNLIKVCQEMKKKLGGVDEYYPQNDNSEIPF